MATKTITAANSVFMLAVTGLFAAPQKLQGYAADAAFETANVTNGEIVMGVDGNMSAGFVYAPREQTISLMPDSPSIPMFEAWDAAQQAAAELFFGAAVISLPAIGESWIGIKGVLRTITPVPGVRRLLTARTFVITWQSLLPSPS